MTSEAEALRTIVGRLGTDLANDPRRVRAALADLGIDRKPAAALAAVAEVRAGSVAWDVPGEPEERRFERLAREVNERSAIEPAFARWAVELWAYALGETPPADGVPLPARAKPGVDPHASTQAAPWAPTHVVDAAGVNTWSEPDPAARPNGRLDPGLAVQVVEEASGWARVVCSNGWEAWTDGRFLHPT